MRVEKFRIRALRDGKTFCAFVQKENGQSYSCTVQFHKAYFTFTAGAYYIFIMEMYTEEYDIIRATLGAADYDVRLLCYTETKILLFQLKSISRTATNISSL